MGKPRHREAKGQLSGRIQWSPAVFPSPCWLNCCPQKPLSMRSRCWNREGTSWGSRGSVCALSRGLLAQQAREPGARAGENGGRGASRPPSRGWGQPPLLAAVFDGPSGPHRIRLSGTWRGPTYVHTRRQGAAHQLPGSPSATCVALSRGPSKAGPGLLMRPWRTSPGGGLGSSAACDAALWRPW